MILKIFAVVRSGLVDNFNDFHTDDFKNETMSMTLLDGFEVFFSCANDEENVEEMSTN